MRKKYVSILVLLLVILPIISISSATETESKNDTIDFNEAKIYIRTGFSPGTHITCYGIPSALLMLTPLYRNVDIEIKLDTGDAYNNAIVLINGEKQIFEESVTITIEGFNGFGSPLYIFAFLQRITLLGSGDITITK